MPAAPGSTGPADPTSAYDARPQWYLRPLFALVNSWPARCARSWRSACRRSRSASWPLLPLVDARPGRRLPPGRWCSRSSALGLARRRWWPAWTSYQPRTMPTREPGATQRARPRPTRRRARTLAQAPTACRWPAAPRSSPRRASTTARTLWARECASCHEGDEREAPLHRARASAGRAHLRSAHHRRVGAASTSAAREEDHRRARTRCPGPCSCPSGTIRAPKADDEGEGEGEGEGARDDGPAGLTPEELDAVVELVYAETGALDVDRWRGCRARQGGLRGRPVRRLPRPAPAPTPAVGPEPGRLRERAATGRR
jgi:hypothetical protein